MAAVTPAQYILPAASVETQGYNTLLTNVQTFVSNYVSHGNTKAEVIRLKRICNDLRDGVCTPADVMAYFTAYGPGQIVQNAAPGSEAECTNIFFHSANGNVSWTWAQCSGCRCARKAYPAYDDCVIQLLVPHEKLPCGCLRKHALLEAWMIQVGIYQPVHNERIAIKERAIMVALMEHFLGAPLTWALLSSRAARQAVIAARAVLIGDADV